MVEAKDMEGRGNMATVPLIIKLLDVNDETPQFEKQTFEFILQPNLRNFTTRAFVKVIISFSFFLKIKKKILIFIRENNNFQATDRDAEKPNNIVRYEIISGNYDNNFILNEITGELFIRGKLTSNNLRQTNSDDTYYPGSGPDSDSNGDVLSVIPLTVRAYDLGK